MNPDMAMKEILEYVELQLTFYRRGILTMEQALDVVGESSRLLRVKVIEFNRENKRKE